MIGNGKMKIKEIELELIGGKELRRRVSFAKDADKYIVWIQKLDQDIIPSVDNSYSDKPLVSWKNREQPKTQQSSEKEKP